MTLLLVSFATASTLLWLSVYGYILLLAVLARDRRRPPAPIDDWPEVALMVPTLNEESTIAAKLADIARTDYPADKLHVVVVDGGSRDRTVAQVRAAVARGARGELWQIDARGSKARQVNYALARLRQAIVVVTDADARLDPSCVRELVGALVDDPQTAVIGASIRVATDLPEERFYWWGIRQLWWLEGAALSAAMVSGVCYAVRRATVVAVPDDAWAEDIHISLRAAAQGRRVRLSRTAWATEVRVPRDAQEWLRFRQRRGSGYLRELWRVPGSAFPLGPRVARAVRLFHFRVTPQLAAVTLGLALMLAATARWWWLASAGLAFVLPPALVLGRARSLREEGSHWTMIRAAARLAGLLWIALLAIRPPRVSSAALTVTAPHPAGRAAPDASVRTMISADPEAAS